MSTTLWLALEPLLSIIFPADCALCANRASGWMCPACKSDLPPAPSPACGRCDHPLCEASQPCPDCSLHAPSFSRAVAVGPYLGRLRDAVRCLKYQDGWRLADSLAGLMLERFDQTWSVRDFDDVVPIPLEGSRLRARGYNQSALLTSRLCARRGLRHSPHLLVRNGGQVQSRLLQQQRHLAMAGRFEAMSSVRGRRILLVDDVLTTGATLSAAAAAIAQQGGQAWAMVLARQSMRRAREGKMLA